MFAHDFKIIFVTFFAVLGASARPNLEQTFSHTKVGYAILNETVVPAPDGCSVTNVSEVASAISSCTTINVGSFEVPVANQPLIMNLQAGTIITFTGQLVFAKNEFKGYLIEIIGNNITVVGTNTHQFHGQGELYWDGKGGAGSTKPTFMYLKGTKGSSFTGLNLFNCPMRCVAIDGSNDITVSGFLIDNRAGAPGTAASGKEGHNTDGFDVAKTQFLTLKDNVVHNQDDCIAINDGAHMIIDNLNCNGSHGFDIATGMSSNSSRNQVNNITFQNSQLVDGMYGLHILTCNDGGTGFVKDIHYKNITFNGPSDYGIMIQQDFSNTAQGSTGNPTGNVPVSNVTYKDITGVMNGKFSSSLSLRCATDSCTDITFDNVSITNGSAANECWNYTISGWC
ncbi:polygalacturonase-like [Anthonomus grandis grandis]|uniref:polygalacturonase-like n=2 Tax=Anthonomus grandis grandis TaxID=2921223 RepID=UPI0021651BBE|nr:polygalacturonase-like [Anthonomus grandis grandis]